MKKASNIAARLLRDGQVTSARDQIRPDLGKIIQKIAKTQETKEKSRFLLTNHLTHSLISIEGR